MCLCCVSDKVYLWILHGEDLRQRVTTKVLICKNKSEHDECMGELKFSALLSSALLSGVLLSKLSFTL